MKTWFFAFVLIIGISSARAGEVQIRDIHLVACTPVSMPDGKRVLHRFSTDKEGCKRIRRSVLVYIAEFGGINALCTFRARDGCTVLADMNDWEREYFEYLKQHARVRKNFGTCIVQGTDKNGRVMWRTEMLTVNTDCKPRQHAMRHWDFMQEKVYLKDGEDDLGVVDFKATLIPSSRGFLDVLRDFLKRIW